MKKVVFLLLIFMSLDKAHAQVTPGNVGTANLTAWFRPDGLLLGNVNSWTTTWPTGPGITLSDIWGTEFPVATNTPPGATSNYNTTIDFFGNNAATAKVLGNGTNLNLLNNNISTGQGTMIAVYYFRPDLLPNGGHVVQYREANSGGDGIQFRGLGFVTPGLGTLRLAIGSGDSPNASRDRPVPIRPSISSYTGNKSSATSMSAFYNNAFYNTNPVSSSTTGSTGLYLGGRLDGGNFSGFHIGYISEVIFYNNNLSNIDRTKVESYLAIKYGITMSNAGGGIQGDYLNASGGLIWDASVQAGYHNDVIGLARDDAQELLQKQSHTFDDTCRIYLGTLQTTNVGNVSAFGNNESFLLMGHNNGRMCGTTQALSEMPESMGSRIEREFKVTKSNFNEIFNWDLKIDSCQDLTLANVANMKLLVDTDGDFSDALSFGVADGLTFTIVDGVLTVSGISNAHVPNNATSYLTVGYEDVYVALTGPESVCAGSDITLTFVIEGISTPIDVTYYTNGTAIPLSSVVNGQQIVVTNSASSFTYGVLPYNSVFNCCTTTTPIESTVTIVPFEPIPIVAHYQDCWDSTFTWVTWNSFSPNLATGTITSLFGEANFTVSHSVGLMSSSPTIFGGAIFPTEYNVPAGETVLRNDSEGTLTFCFDQPILNPYFLFASIGTPSISVPVSTSTPYEIVWAGEAVTYQDSLNFAGTEGYNIISFAGWHTCLEVSFLASEVWTNITIGNYLPNCPADTVCEGTAVVLNAGELGTYNWSPATFLDTTAGNSVVSTPFNDITYTVQNSNSIYCLSPSDFTIITIPNEAPEFTQVPGLCAGDELAPLPTTSNNGVPGTWSPEINNTETTTYLFTAQSCASTATMTINVEQYVTPTFTIPLSVCENAPIANFPNTSNNGISGNWSPAPNNQITTTYTFTPNPGGGCVLPFSHEIQVEPNVQPIFNIINNYCWGDNIPNLPTNSQNGVAGSWSPNLNNQNTTSYSFAPNPGVCALPASQLITINPLPNFDLGPDLTLCPDVIQTIGAPSGYSSYIWNIGATTPTINITESGFYELTVFNEFNCQKTDNVDVLYLMACGDLELPNVFSPNGDVINDLYSYSIKPNISDYNIVIVNRWGQEVFSTSDKTKFWDGIDQFTGEKCKDGVYFYFANYRRIDVEGDFKKQGFLHLIRE